MKPGPTLINGIMACLTEKAAIMGSSPGEVSSGPDGVEKMWPMGACSRGSRQGRARIGMADRDQVE